MIDYIICPNCGKKINPKQCETVDKLFFSYKICTNCGSNFTKADGINKIFFHIIFHNAVLIILGVGNLLLDFANKKVVHILFPIMFSAAAAGIVFNYIQLIKQKKELNNSSNAFLPIIEYKKIDKIFKHVYENELSEKEKELRYLAINTENILYLRPCPNLYMLFKAQISMSKLKNDYTYKILVSRSELFVILSDLRICDENVILCFKSFVKTSLIQKENEYNLLTLNDEMIGTVMLVNHLE